MPDEAAALERARFGADYENAGPATLETYHLVSCLRMGRLLRARAWVAISDGRSAHAYRDIVWRLPEL